MLYRQIQIFVILSDKCFQAYLWPSIEFYGSVGVIAVLYILLVFKVSLPYTAVFVMIALVLSLVIVMCLLMGMGSNLIIISGKTLQRVKHWNTNLEHRWTRKMFKSYQRVTIRVGDFHKMDRKRVPSLMRFILQRTFFLVIQTKLSINTNHVENFILLTLG